MYKAFDMWNALYRYTMHGIYFFLVITTTNFVAPGIMSGGALAGDFTLPPAALASVSLPPSLFGDISVERVGIFFALYRESTLFPVRDVVDQASTNSTLRLAVASPVIAATVGPGFNFSNLVQPVQINLRTNLTSFEVSL